MNVSALRRLSERVNRIVIAVTIGLIVVMFSVSLFGIVFNVVTGAPPSWSYSLARLFVPWIAMLSLTVAFKSGEHVAMTAMTRLIPARVRGALVWINVGIIGLFALALVWYGALFVAGSTQLFMISDFLQVSHRWVVVSVPVAGAILAVHLAAGPALLTPADADEAAP